ncbi:MAG: hypothetical protein DRP06_03830 [Candidatus Aenigmatarchaeota archaeon]|nr:MAG: hypothetical protein DRP06_03830 [Candidatus Aenigmarchaeota archaeon]
MFDLEVAGIVVLFLIFVYLVYKGVELLLRYLAISCISALFPVIMIVFFGVDWPLNLGTILFFVYLGILGYTIYTGLSFIEMIVKSISKLFSDGKKKKAEENTED